MLLQEHLLIIAAEECAEVAHRISKALRFGLDEIQEGQELSNSFRILQEYSQLQAVMEMLCNSGAIPFTVDRSIVSDKHVAVQKFLEYSKKCGTLTE